MKKINELKDERTQLVLRYNELMEVEKRSDEQRSEADGLSKQISDIDKDIQLLERQEELNVKAASSTPVEETEERKVDLVKGLREFLMTGKAPEEFRSERGGFLLRQDAFQYRDNLSTTKGSEFIPTIVDGQIVIAKTPAQTMLESLGVKMYPGLQGNFVIPSAAQITANSPGEATAVADASINPTGLTLAPVRTGAFQTITKELLAQTNPAIYAGIVQDLVDAVWRQVGAVFFDNLQTDAVDASTAKLGTYPTFANIVSLEGNVPYDMVSPAYVTTPGVAASLKQTATIASVTGPVWEGPNAAGMVNGYKAVATGLANTDTLIFGDFSKAAIGMWGDVELLVNPYAYDAEGMIKVTASGLFDSGVPNYRFFSWSPDASAL